MTKQLEVLRNKEDGQLTVAYNGINLDDYDYLTVKEFVEEVESADMWSDIDYEVYKKALDEYNLDYDSYDDPEAMWSDFLKSAEADR
ncbi:hypothetical protein [Anaerococcus nagyae]|uniref:hypothetical protein n=1 Tax=Anaerococcus nagyae TaxID=1755241 RepID=UPI0032457F0F